MAGYAVIFRSRAALRCLRSRRFRSTSAMMYHARPPKTSHIALESVLANESFPPICHATKSHARPAQKAIPPTYRLRANALCFNMLSTRCSLCSCVRAGVGAPQCGQAVALSETLWPHSVHREIAIAVCRLNVDLPGRHNNSTAFTMATGNGPSSDIHTAEVRRASSRCRKSRSMRPTSRVVATRHERIQRDPQSGSPVRFQSAEPFVGEQCHVQLLGPAGCG